MELPSSDAAAILFFLEEEIEKNGGANRADSVAHPYKGSQKIYGIASQCAHWLAMTLQYEKNK